MLDMYFREYLCFHCVSSIMICKTRQSLFQIVGVLVLCFLFLRLDALNVKNQSVTLAVKGWYRVLEASEQGIWNFVILTWDLTQYENLTVVISWHLRGGGEYKDCQQKINDVRVHPAESLSWGKGWGKGSRQTWLLDVVTALLEWDIWRSVQDVGDSCLSFCMLNILWKIPVDLCDGFSHLPILWQNLRS